VTLTRLEKCPWPYPGGKTDAAPAIWAALGDVEHFADPFCGSLAALLLRPHPCNRTYYSETVNDKDGLLVNAFRSIQLSPDATAEAASWYVSEADLHARHLAILKWQSERELEHLMGDHLFHDPVIAGYWIWGMSCWIGSGFASGVGPWVVGPGGRIMKRTGSGGVSRQLPHLTNGQGVNRPQSREPGVHRKRPHIGDDGCGVNTAAVRERGVSTEEEYHPLTMPEVRRWFAFLSARLRHVRILNGDWKRAVTNGALKTLMVRQGKGHVGVLLDPPYRVTGTRDKDLYTHDGGDETAAEVREWCKANGADPEKRIVLCGFSGEGHEELESLGWRCESWFTTGFLKGGYAQQGEEGTAQHLERLWLSPHCLRPAEERAAQLDMFEGAK
jgi:hypothetical protein